MTDRLDALTTPESMVLVARAFSSAHEDAPSVFEYVENRLLGNLGTLPVFMHLFLMGDHLLLPWQTNFLGNILQLSHLLLLNKLRIVEVPHGGMP